MLCERLTSIEVQIRTLDELIVRSSKRPVTVPSASEIGIRTIFSRA
jgi:hypothetical protein